MTNVQIRYATEEDAGFFKKFDSEPPWNEPIFEPTVRPRRKALNEDNNLLQYYLERQGRGEASLFVANLGKDLVGFGAVNKRTRRMGHLGDLHLKVTEDFTHQGIGEVLLKCLLAEANSFGIKTLLVDSCEPDEETQKFLEKHGFVEYGLLPSAIMDRGSKKLVSLKNYYKEL